MPEINPTEVDPQTGPDTAPSEETSFSPSNIPQGTFDEIKDPDVAMFDIPIKLSKEDEDEIISYLENNLTKMRPPGEEKQKIMNYLAMYEMYARKRAFPYEGAPSLASSDAHDVMNSWLDQAETAFLSQKVTFTIDRQETRLSEDRVNRMENTYQRRFFMDSFAGDLRLMLFEAGFLGASVLNLKEIFDIQSVKEKIVIKNENDLAKYQSVLTSAQSEAAKKKIAKGDLFTAERDAIKVVNIGPKISRTDMTKFWFPRNTKSQSEWQIVAEPEFYTKSALRQMAAMGELDADAVEEAIDTRKSLYQYEMGGKKTPLPEYVKYHKDLDAEWAGDIEKIKQYGDAYEDEFATYRVTLRYNLKTEADKQGVLRPWIQVIYCPCGKRIFGAKFCQDGFPYYIIQRRHVPYKAMGPGIAQERLNHNILATDIMSLFLASLEQEIGAPLLIRKNSMLSGSAFRSYPGSVAITDDVNKDAAFMPFPDKSRLAVEGISVVLGSSPGANKGAGYSSGKRTELDQQKEMVSTKARINSIAMDLDKVFNGAWRIHCRLAKFNLPNKKILSWVYDEAPTDGTKLFILEDEMDPNIVWTCVASAITLTPDARLQKALLKFDFFHTKVPVSVNNPKLTIQWLQYMADQFDMDDNDKKKLLPSEEDFAQLQQQLGAQGGDQQQAQGTALTAQSPNTPFRNPGQQQPPR